MGRLTSLAVVALLAFGGWQCAHKDPPAPAAPPSPSAQPAATESIGVATMEADGTIVLRLRASAPGGVSGEGFFRYPPGHAEYDNVLKHLGGLKPGDSKPVPPWRD